MSYGTLLGQNFAAMFPERVDRMVLDSVVDAPDDMAASMSPPLERLFQFHQLIFSAGYPPWRTRKNLSKLSSQAVYPPARTSVPSQTSMAQKQPLIQPSLLSTPPSRVPPSQANHRPSPPPRIKRERLPNINSLRGHKIQRLRQPLPRHTISRIRG